ncbi:MAG: hypothetical protein HOW97_08050 [Catenulispora sp.]|nr:hypothetical protein [Catenulispora sp.]
MDSFTIIPNGTLRDERLSYCARGVLAELLSRPENWETNADSISERARKHRDVVGEGRRAIRAAFAELEAAGYMVRKRERVPKGQKGGGDFVTVLEVYDVPQERSHGGTADATSIRVTSIGGTSMSGTSSRRTDVRSTEDEDAGYEHSASLAAAREGEDAHARELRRAELLRLYEAANQLDNERLRRHLLAFERKRPVIYRECRQAALGQIGGEQGGRQLMAGPDGVRAIDLLSFKYALQHYAGRLPDWLVKLPR